jgi:hypothetical protein
MMRAQKEANSARQIMSDVPVKTRGSKNGGRNYLSDLRAAIEDGWQIVQPIFSRPLWNSLNDEKTAYHFVLQREKATRLVTVPESRTLMRFIRDQSLMIDKRG